jgi:hypothetical protein
MKRFPFVGVVLLIPALSLLILTACSDKKAPTGTTAADKTTTPTGDNKGAKVKYKGETEGTIKGTVKIKGEAPKMEDIKALLEMKGGEKAICEAGDKKEQLWIINKSGGVANVVVWLEPADGKEFDIKDSLKEPFKKAVVIEQPNCQYVPHVAAVYADFQPLLVKSSPNKITHNVKVAASKVTKAADKNLVQNDPAVEHNFKLDPRPIDISCSIHTWMQAKVLTFDHPYFAVSKDDGTFEIKNAPIGEDLVLYVWHESMNAKVKHNAAYQLKKGDNTLSLEINAKGEVK